MTDLNLVILVTVLKKAAKARAMDACVSKHINPTSPIIVLLAIASNAFVACSADPTAPITSARSVLFSECFDYVMES